MSTSTGTLSFLDFVSITRTEVLTRAEPEIPDPTNRGMRMGDSLLSMGKPRI